MNEFSPEEKEQIFSMAENITGNCQQGNYRREVIISNVLRRVVVKKSPSLQSYLQEAISDDKEFSYLISSLTIHTTEWFREMPHYTKFDALLREKYKESKRIKLLSTACSTGEEVFSFAMVLESYKKINVRFEYEIAAFDIDPVSVEIAKKSLYALKDLPKIPANYQPFLKKMSTEDSFSFEPSVKLRCKFYTDNLVKLQNTLGQYDVVVCRNVLIYFTPDKVKLIIQTLLDKLMVGGVLIIGHSDSLNPKDFKVKSLGNSMFEKL